MDDAALWALKRDAGAAVRAFEAQRSQQIDRFQTRDRDYWRQFQDELRRGGEEVSRLQKFLSLRLQADLSYAEALRGTRAPLDVAESTNEMLSVQSTTAKALHSVGEVQQQLAEKLTQLVAVVKREVVAKLDEMAVSLKERADKMVLEGSRLDEMLFRSQQNVLAAFGKFDELLKQLESQEGKAEGATDLWLAQMNYCVNVQKLQQCRVAYVTGMSALFQQYKTMEVWRESVVQTALDTYVRKQKLTFGEMAGAMVEPLAAAQRIDPDRDLLQSVRRIPKNYTAAALSESEDTEEKLFSTLQSPIASPLLVRCGFLKRQVSGSLFSSWKDVMCAITQDGCLHMLDLKESTTRSITESTEAMLAAIATSDQTNDVTSVSVSLANCRIEILGKSATPSFEITEQSSSSGLLSSVFRLELSRTLTFQCSSQSDLIDWVVAAKRFISAGSSMVNR